MEIKEIEPVEPIGLKCVYCSWEWVARVIMPKVCPKCHKFLPWKKDKNVLLVD